MKQKLSKPELERQIALWERAKKDNPDSSLIPAIDDYLVWLRKQLKEFEKGGAH